MYFFAINYFFEDSTFCMGLSFEHKNSIFFHLKNIFYETFLNEKKVVFFFFSFKKQYTEKGTLLLWDSSPNCYHLDLIMRKLRDVLQNKWQIVFKRSVFVPCKLEDTSYQAPLILPPRIMTIDILRHTRHFFLCLYYLPYIFLGRQYYAIVPVVT